MGEQLPRGPLNRRSIGVVRAATLLVTIAGAALACERAPQRAPVPPPEHRIIIEGAKVERLESDQPAYELEARRLVMSQDSNRVEVTDVTIHTRSSSGTPVTVTAPKGVGDRTVETARLWGGVEVVSEGVTLRSDTADLDWRAQRVVATSTVTAKGANFDARARSGTYRLDEARVVIEGPVSARVR